MIAVKVSMKVTREPLKRTPIVLKLDVGDVETPSVLTDRAGIAKFDMLPTSGRILVAGVERYDGRLEGEIPRREQGSNHALHKLFPRGGPQKQSNRLAGFLRTKGEH